MVHVGTGRTAIGLALLAFATLPQSPPKPEPTNWIVTAGDVTRVDKLHILELAKRAGIPDPDCVTLELTRMPLGCFDLRVQSRPVVTGPRRRWTEVRLNRIGAEGEDRYCPATASSKNRLGRWAVDGDAVVTQETWRVQEGTWIFDVALEDVPYEVAARLVLAVKHRDFIDRRIHAIRSRAVDLIARLSRAAQSTPTGCQLMPLSSEIIAVAPSVLANTLCVFGERVGPALGTSCPIKGKRAQ